MQEKYTIPLVYYESHVIYNGDKTNGKSVVTDRIKAFWNELQKKYRLEKPNYRGKNISEVRLNGIYGVGNEFNSRTYIHKTDNIQIVYIIHEM